MCTLISVQYKYLFLPFRCNWKWLQSLWDAFVTRPIVFYTIWQYVHAEYQINTQWTNLLSWQGWLLVWDCVPGTTFYIYNNLPGNTYPNGNQSTLPTKSTTTKLPPHLQDGPSQNRPLTKSPPDRVAPPPPPDKVTLTILYYFLGAIEKRDGFVYFIFSWYLDWGSNCSNFHKLMYFIFQIISVC